MLIPSKELATVHAPDTIPRYQIMPFHHNLINSHLVDDMNKSTAMKRKSMDVQMENSSAKRVRFAEYSQLALTEPGSVVSQQSILSFLPGGGRCCPKRILILLF